MGYAADRTGHGRWVTILTPHPGMLWTNDRDSVGFTPVGEIATEDGVVNYDGADMRQLIDDQHAAGKTPTEAFELLARLTGRNLQEGDLDTWRPSRARRVDLGDIPPMRSTAEVVTAIRDTDATTVDPGPLW